MSTENNNESLQSSTQNRGMKRESSSPAPIAKRLPLSWQKQATIPGGKLVVFPKKATSTRFNRQKDIYGEIRTNLLFEQWKREAAKRVVFEFDVKYSSKVEPMPFFVYENMHMEKLAKIFLDKFELRNEQYQKLLADLKRSFVNSSQEDFDIEVPAFQFDFVSKLALRATKSFLTKLMEREKEVKEKVEEEDEVEEEKENLIRIMVEKPDGTHVPIRLEPECQMEKLRRFASAITQLAEGSFEMLHNGYRVHDERTIEANKIENEDIVTVRLKRSVRLAKSIRRNK